MSAWIDIAEQLRETADVTAHPQRSQLMREAADEIERLRAEVELWKDRYDTLSFRKTHLGTE